MNIGGLRHRLKLTRKTETRDAHGGTVYTPATFATVWGRVKPLTGKELIDADQTETQVDHLIEIRRRSDIKANDQVVHLNRTFEIVSFRDVEERHRKTHLMCKEIVA